MNIKTALNSEISRQLSPLGGIQAGVICSFNAKARTIDIKSQEGGQDIFYNGVLLPSLGTGIKVTDIKINTPVVFTFLANMRDYPIVLSILTGNGFTPDNAEDVSAIGTYGRLTLRSFL